MKNSVWKKTIAPYIKNPAFISYGAFEEKRPVEVDCSMGINPLQDLYRGAIVPVNIADYGGYPKSGAHGHKGLAAYLAKRWNKVDQDSFCFGAGSQGILSSLSRILGGPQTKLLGMLPQYLPGLLEFASAGVTLETIRLEPGNYTVNVDRLIAALQPDTTLVYLDNPHNPTGQLKSLGEVQKLADACLENGTLLVVDEAYGDFVDDSCSAMNLTHENLICMRSFSKGCGLAGLRVGYIVIRDEELRHYYRELGLHFSSSAVSTDLAAAMVPQLDLPPMRVQVQELKARLLSFIGQYKDFTVAETYASTPIILLSWQKNANLYDALMEVGIQAEPGLFFAMEGENSVRLRAPMQEQFTRFCELWEKRFGKP